MSYSHWCRKPCRMDRSYHRLRHRQDVADPDRSTWGIPACQRRTRYHSTSCTVSSCHTTGGILYQLQKNNQTFKNQIYSALGDYVTSLIRLYIRWKKNKTFMYLLYYALGDHVTSLIKLYIS